MSEKKHVERHSARLSSQKWLERRADAGVWFFPLRSPLAAARAAGSDRRLILGLVSVVIMLLLAGCGSAPKKPSAAAGKGGAYYLDDGPGPRPPANLDAIPDAVPRNEPFHRGANRPYTVLGKTYVPKLSNERFKQKGIASWYGRKYHGQKTANGETYDMYAMSAAHPTLPLPCYVRVTNPANGRAVVVRVNDRGPFLSDRIIDLSFAAANRLDIARRGSAQVIVERVFPGDKPGDGPLVAEAPSKAVSIPVAPSVSPPLDDPAGLPPNTIAASPNVAASPITTDSGALFLQLGAFASRENAEIFRTRMRSELEWNREPILLSQAAAAGLFRVRLGPYKNRDEAQAIADQVKASLNFLPLIAKP